MTRPDPTPTESVATMLHATRVVLLLAGATDGPVVDEYHTLLVNARDLGVQHLPPRIDGGR